jgi:hypothetical protein
MASHFASTREDFRSRLHRRMHLLTIITTTVGQRGNSPSEKAASQSETREMRADDAVALARRRFESLSVQDLDSPVAARD